MFFYGNIDRLKLFILTMHNTVEFVFNKKVNVLLVLLLMMKIRFLASKVCSFQSQYLWKETENTCKLSIKLFLMRSSISIQHCYSKN